MNHITATEVRISYDQELSRMARQGSRIRRYLNKQISKLSLRILTNQGPVLGFVESVVVINKLGDKK